MFFSNLRDYLLSPWSFFFRWPVIRVRTFRPQALLLGPLYQAGVFTLAWWFLSFLNIGSQPFQMLVAAFFLAAFTGFFHEDGFADTADSLGVSKFNSSDEVLGKIQNAFKDPRLGTFGVSGLLLLWFYRYSATFLFRFSIYQMIFCYLVSRSAALLFGVICARVSKNASNARASHLMTEIGSAAALVSFVLMSAFAVGLWAWGTWQEHSLGLPGTLAQLSGHGVALAAGTLCGGVLGGAVLVKRSETLNGDILGAVACGSEIIAGLLFAKFF